MRATTECNYYAQHHISPNLPPSVRPSVVRTANAHIRMCVCWMGWGVSPCRTNCRHRCLDAPPVVASRNEFRINRIQLLPQVVQIVCHQCAAAVAIFVLCAVFVRAISVTFSECNISVRDRVMCLCCVHTHTDTDTNTLKHSKCTQQTRHDAGRPSTFVFCVRCSFCMFVRTRPNVGSIDSISSGLGLVFGPEIIRSKTKTVCDLCCSKEAD